MNSTYKNRKFFVLSAGGNGFSPLAMTDGFSSASTASSTSSSGLGPKAINRSKAKPQLESGMNGNEIKITEGENMADEKWLNFAIVLDDNKKCC